MRWLQLAALVLLVANVLWGWQLLGSNKTGKRMCGLLWWMVTGLLFCTVMGPKANATAPTIPPAAIAYRLSLEHAATAQFGLNAPVARLAAQIQQESSWKPAAVSPYAQGLAQFTPATARWLPDICPDVGPPDPWNPQWSVVAMVCYDAWLHDKIHPHGTAMTACAHWAMTLSAYNGGLGWVQRDRATATRTGHPPDIWFGGVDRVNAGRSAAAWGENRAYPRRILLMLEPTYLAAGWPGRPVCP